MKLNSFKKKSSILIRELSIDNILIKEKNKLKKF